MAKSAGVDEGVIQAYLDEVNSSEWLALADLRDTRDHEERKDERDRLERREERQDRLTLWAAIVGGLVIGSALISGMLLATPDHRDDLIDKIATFLIGSGVGSGSGYALGRNRLKRDP